MKSRITSSAAVLAAALVTSHAQAADLGGSIKDDYIPAPAFSWRGFYIGGQLGGATNGDVTTTYEQTGNFEFAGTNKLTDADGFVGGGQIGFNHVMGSVVVGIEASIAAGSLDDEISENPPPVGNDYRTSTDIDYLGSVTGRLGFAFDRTLIYAKGGYAFTSVDFNASFFNKDGPGGTNGTQVRISNDYSLDGWTIGGGLEYALTDSVTLGVEYSHYEFDSETATLSTTNSGILTETVSSDLDIDVINARLNFKFGG